MRPCLTARDTTMRRHIAWAHRLIVAGLVLCLLGSGSLAVGLLLLATNFDIGSGAFLGYLILSSAFAAGGVIAMLVAFLLE
jgi:hypothetical protein